jgi:hypothetical protein
MRKVIAPRQMHKEYKYRDVDTEVAVVQETRFLRGRAEFEGQKLAWNFVQMLIKWLECFWLINRDKTNQKLTTVGFRAAGSQY